MRAGVLTMGPLLARYPKSKIRVALGGGCALGIRDTSWHLSGFKSLGADNILKRGYVNIYSKKGTKVMSSQAGKVIYCGNEIPGYGNLILIKHSKNWITAYAHLNEVFTEKGEKVNKGETIGSVGNTGNVRSPQLHFEIRKGKESVNPLKLL